jgi:hypothetical protein
VQDTYWRAPEAASVFDADLLQLEKVCHDASAAAARTR